MEDYRIRNDRDKVSQETLSLSQSFRTPELGVTHSNHLVRGAGQAKGSTSS